LHLLILGIFIGIFIFTECRTNPDRITVIDTSQAERSLQLVRDLEGQLGDIEKGFVELETNITAGITANGDLEELLYEYFNRVSELVREIQSIRNQISESKSESH